MLCFLSSSHPLFLDQNLLEKENGDASWHQRGRWGALGFSLVPRMHSVTSPLQHNEKTEV